MKYRYTVHCGQQVALGRIHTKPRKPNGTRSSSRRYISLVCFYLFASSDWLPLFCFPIFPSRCEPGLTVLLTLHFVHTHDIHYHGHTHTHVQVSINGTIYHLRMRVAHHDNRVFITRISTDC